MSQLRMHVRLIRPLAALLLATVLHGCMRWTPVPEPRTLPYAHAKAFRVTLSNGGIIDVKQPFIVGDSLLWLEPQRTGLPLAQISLLEARTQDKVATTLLVAAVVVPITIWATVALLGCSMYDADRDPSDCN